MTALYLERFLNYGITREELQSGRPIIGSAQTGSDLVPRNRHHVELAERVRDGIRDAGGIPLEFPVHPLQETGIDDQFIRDVSHQIAPGTSALFLYVTRATTDEVLERFLPYHPSMIHTTLSPQAEEKLREAMHGEVSG